jgi:hypothetical protein
MQGAPVVSGKKIFGREKLIGAIMTAGLTALSMPSQAQSNNAIPDFGGLWARTYIYTQTFDPPASGPGPIVQNMRYPGVNANGRPRGTLTEEQRANVIAFTNNWVPDVSSPILQPRTKAALEDIAAREIAGIPRPQSQTQCMPSGMPHILNSTDAVMILQTPTEVLFLYSRDHHVRHVYLNEKHTDNPEPSWWGESIGHYEGDILVVDTIGQTDIPETDRFGTPHSTQIRVVERYRLSDDGSKLEGHFTVEDPIAFTVPWSARADYARDKFGFLEYVCAENPREFWPGVPIVLPTDTTPDF